MALICSCAHSADLQNKPKFQDKSGKMQAENGKLVNQCEAFENLQLSYCVPGEHERACLCSRRNWLGCHGALEWMGHVREYSCSGNQDAVKEML